MLGNYLQQTTSADVIFAIFLGALRVKVQIITKDNHFFLLFSGQITLDVFKIIICLDCENAHALYLYFQSKSFRNL